MKLDEALELALDGHAVLFLGAGFSRGATNWHGSSLKSAGELAAHLAQKANLSENTPLEDASEEFIVQHGEERLVTELKSEFAVSEVSQFHRDIAKIPWRRVYTTNYDDVIEKAYSDVQRTLKPVTLSHEARLRSDHSSETLCVHLNGFVNLLTSQSIGSELKLTDTSYLSASISESSWSALFRQDLLLARTVFFIGYSLSDLDIRRLLFDSNQLRDKCFFVVGQSPDDLTKRRAARFGEVVSINTSEFADILIDKSSKYIPQEADNHIGYSIQRFTPPDTTAELADQAIFNLLLWGVLKPELIWDSLHEGGQYFLERPDTRNVLRNLNIGNPIAAIHSELGNGKTLLLEGIKCRALEEGYEVYTVSVRSGDLFRELDLILRSDDKIILFIDNYPDWMDVIEYFSLNAQPNHALVISARNAVHDVMIDRVCQLIGRDDILEYPSDSLCDMDLEWVIDLFNQYGLWGNKASWGRRRKMRYLSRDCNSHLSSILMKLFQSPQIATRFNTILKRLNDRRDYYEVLLSTMVLAAIQHVPTTNLMMDIWGNVVLETQFKRNEAIREFFDFQAGEIRLRSATAAQFILRNVADANLTVNTLVVMSRAFDRAGKFSDLHRVLLRNLMRYSTLQSLLPEKHRRAATIRYYEGVKNLYGCQKNPQFWLQYAIACLTLGELNRAERYFETSYSLAKARGYDTYQIDNHYARFLLRRAIQLGNPDACMASFRSARNIIERQIKDDRLHYPYRVAKSYYDFYDAFESKIESTYLDEIYRAAMYVIRRIESLPDYRQNHKDVLGCYLDMQRIVAKKEEIAAT